jgi:23S rRNA (uracil1939-C5)-methyltransferase
MSDELPIHDLAPMGDGVHQSERGRIYVDRALPGDVIETKIKRGAGGVMRGDLGRILQASPHRVKAPCVHYDVCGGCALQHVEETFYRTWKADVVRRVLEKNGLKPAVWHAPVFLPGGLRRRVTFAAYKKKNGVTLGYFRRRTHVVTDVAGCLVAEPAFMVLRAKLATALAPILQDGKTADVFIQSVNGACEIVITGPIGKKGRPDLQVHEAIADLAHAANISRVSWRAQERGEPEVLLEINPLLAVFGELNVALPPLAFLQPTKAGEDALAAAVMDLMPKSGKFADLFSGCGTFSGPMLARGVVDAYESNEAAVRALSKSKGAHPLTATQRDLFRDPLRPDETARYGAIVFDPPRAGAEEQAKALASSAVPLLIGVSCNPVSFARDARILVDGGYHLESVKVVDQFTWSHHVELVASFRRM